ncbi:hypothetical protein SARC_16791, partial [Sphaeroforma arctica JP610]
EPGHAEQFGITEPISVEPPTVSDLKQTKSLLKLLDESDIFESPKEEQLRYV